jgi:hypothetical protein
VQKFYPKLNEHNQDHAHLLVEGSNIDFWHVIYQHCCSRIDDKKVIHFKCQCIPSQKTAVKSANEVDDKEMGAYMIYIIFDGNEGKILSYPYLCCGCYDGWGFCSHLLVLLVVFHLAQCSKSKVEFEELMPDSLVMLQGIPTLIENLVT